MSILLSDKLLKCISEELSELKESVLIISAYCKLPLIKYFDSCIKNVNADKTLVVRFRPDDIISGSSDLELYSYCKDNGWKLYFRLDLHAKTYVFDRIRCIIGSANATSRAQIPSHTKCCQENIMIPFFIYFTITHGKERLNNV